mmetsp:Transcript_7596/g.11502  ORF Transcript_7596/g.11502 Transcript_7596/m.11502 type:complete len:500 (-) Transcript_7596:94-1593(-)
MKATQSPRAGTQSSATESLERKDSNSKGDVKTLSSSQEGAGEQKANGSSQVSSYGGIQNNRYNSYSSYPTGMGGGYGYGYNGGYGGYGGYGSGYGRYGGYGGMPGAYGGMYGGGAYGQGYPGTMNSFMSGSQRVMNAINQPMRVMSYVSSMLGQSFQALHMSFSGILNLAMGAQLIRHEIRNAAITLSDSSASSSSRNGNQDSRVRDVDRPATWGEFLRLYALTYLFVKVLKLIIQKIRNDMTPKSRERLQKAWLSARGKTGGGETWGSTLLISLAILILGRYIHRWVMRRFRSRQRNIADTKSSSSEEKLSKEELAWRRLKKDVRLAEALGSSQVMRALVANVNGQHVTTKTLDEDIKKLMIEKRAELLAISKDAQLVEQLSREEFIKVIQVAQSGDEPLPENGNIQKALVRMHALLQEHCGPDSKQVFSSQIDSNQMQMQGNGQYGSNRVGNYSGYGMNGMGYNMGGYGLNGYGYGGGHGMSGYNMGMGGYGMGGYY